MKQNMKKTDKGKKETKQNTNKTTPKRTVKNKRTRSNKNPEDGTVRIQR